MFPHAMTAAELYEKDYATVEPLVWKYTYKVLVIHSKLYQMLNSLQHSEKYMNLAFAVVKRQDKGLLEQAKLHRTMAFQYWKFYRKAKCLEHLEQAQPVFE